MTDRGTEPPTPAEARLAARLHRSSDRGLVPVDAAAIAGRSVAAGRRHPMADAQRLGRMGLRRAAVGIAAVLLLALGRPLEAGVTLPDPAPAVVDRAVVTREVEGALDVVLVRPDGTERLLRHVTAEGLGFAPGSGISRGGGLGRLGWLELHVSPPEPDPAGRAPYGHDVLIDLADPGRAPIVLAANGFMSGVWGPDGRYAHDDLIRTSPVRTGKGGPIKGGRTSGGAVTVIDPEAGEASAIGVPSVQTFGGGPVIVWAADGSGFLARQDDQWGVTSIETGRFVPGVPRLHSRSLDLERPGFDHPGWLSGADPGGVRELLGGEPVGAQLTADGMGLWELVDTSDATRSQAVLVRLTGPGAVASVHTFDLPAGPSDGPGRTARGFTLAADDTMVALDIPALLGSPFVLAPLGSGDERASTGPAIDGALAGMVAGTEADAWPGP